MYVELQEVVEALQDTSRDVWFYYDPQEEVVFDQTDYTEEDTDCIPLPTAQEINSYSIMEAFVERMEDSEEKKWLENSLKGKGAFRRFRATIERFQLDEEWEKYQESIYYGLAIEWCNEHGIEYDLLSAPVIETVEKKKEIQQIVHQYRIVRVHQKNYLNLLNLLKENHGWQLDEAQEELEYQLEGNRTLFAAVEQGRYVGYISCSAHEETLFVEDLFVSVKDRKRGAGTLLLQEVEKYADEEECRLLFRVPVDHEDVLKFLNQKAYSQKAYLEIGKL